MKTVFSQITEVAMQVLSAIPISRKLPAVIAALCVTASVCIAVVGYLDFRKNILEQAQSNFSVLTEGRGDALVTWSQNISKNVSAFGKDPSVIAAVSAFNSSYNLMIDSAGLQDAYIVNNPNPVGQKDQFDQAPESIPYHFQHGRFHPYFRQVKDAAGYYDIFIFNLNGDLMYSVFKEADYATNFVTGPYASTGLGQAFAAAREGESGQVYVADFARYAPSADAPAAFVATPVQDETGNTVGVFAIQLPIGQIAQIANKPVGLGETGEVYVVGPDFRTRTASRFDTGHAVLHDASGMPQVLDALKNEPAFFAETVGIAGMPVLTNAASVDVFGIRWGIVGEIDLAEVNIPAINVRNKMIVVTLLVAGIGAFLGWLTARSVVSPLDRLGIAMRQVSEKKYDMKLQDEERGDEIGNLSRALAEFRDKLQASDLAEHERELRQAEQAQVVHKMSAALTQLADGNLLNAIEAPFPDEYDQLRQDYNRTLENLNRTIGSVVGRASAIRQRSDEMSRESDDLSRRTENQAATLEETAAALDELTASVKSASDGAVQVEAVVGDARQDAQESEPVVQNAVRAMTEIEKSSTEISQIIGVIDDIAFQTNLLALNAGVEAARAGEAGRGFAVVASEVRALAQRSSEAAKQIKTLISESSGQVERGVNLVGQAGDVLTKIAAHINNISGYIGQIAAGAQEQSTGLGEINIGVTQLDKVTQQNAAMVEQATANSHALNKDAGEMAELVTQFKLRNLPEQTAKMVDNIATFVPQRAIAAADHDEAVEQRPSSRLAVAGERPSAHHTDNFWQEF